MTAGRPTGYSQAYHCDKAFKLALLGCTDKEIAELLEIAESTLNNWKLKHPEFVESLKKGKEDADSNVADRLYQRAMGYEHDDVDIRVCGKAIIQTKIRKYYPPDPVAAIFWLKNRRRSDWKDKSEVGISAIEPIILQDEDGNKMAELGFRKKAGSA